jgi:translation initiation factor 2 alpha subunit (eIF-2alpha)
MAPTAVKLRTVFELNCFTSEGIEAIKESLIAAKKVLHDESLPLDYKIIAPP